MRQAYDHLLQRARVVDQKLFRTARPVLMKTRSRDLKVPRLRMNQCFAELVIDVLNEASAEDQARNAERDGA
jgi:hypothetical protein